MTGLEYIHKLALSARDDAMHVINNIALMSSLPAAAVRQAQDNLISRGRIALHFHPDRLVRGNITVIDSMLSDGCYRNQFETHISNGLLSPEIGGQRDHWEMAYFHQPSLALKQRPKYGALDLGLHANGPAPRFGAAYLLSKSELLERCSFCYLDSYRQPKERATSSCFEPVFAALMSECFERDYGLGCEDFRPPALVNWLCNELKPLAEPQSKPVSANLDHYIEAQVHGEVSLLKDIDLLVLDASYRGTETGAAASLLCEKYHLSLSWSPSLTLNIEEVPADYRGKSMPQLARRVAPGGVLNVRLIGAAARSVACGDPEWTQLGSPSELTQQLKLLWHVLLRFGKKNQPVQSTD
ncbi:DUF3626 domain-containing protein [Shewanella submarina]|uniref:DUF3626 domain-containing protein n=1 Tax=Shewanella submarina TaxID=2016376 RepID=A0ABV7G6N2_9GAMM|nr:DUF3626 domain-containing protein [Shewanella submarina]MCL1037434.1 DUF3626 domain-containing protein [Shewanella submarina]